MLAGSGHPSSQGWPVVAKREPRRNVTLMGG